MKLPMLLSGIDGIEPEWRSSVEHVTEFCASIGELIGGQIYLTLLAWEGRRLAASRRPGGFRAIKRLLAGEENEHI